MTFICYEDNYTEDEYKAFVKGVISSAKTQRVDTNDTEQVLELIRKNNIFHIPISVVETVPIIDLYYDEVAFKASPLSYFSFRKNVYYKQLKKYNARNNIIGGEINKKEIFELVDLNPYYREDIAKYLEVTDTEERIKIIKQEYRRKRICPFCEERLSFWGKCRNCNV